MTRKHRTSLYVDPGLMKQVDHLAARKGWTKSAVIEAAVASFLSPDAAERQEAALSRRLDRISRQLDRLAQDQNIGLEAVGLFVRHWLTVTPQLPAAAQRAARAAGRERYQGFLDALARALAKGGGLTTELSRDVPADGPPERSEPEVE